MAERDLGNRLRRAVKDNNLPLVRRLVQRTPIRNPDPDHKRYTSLAWAAALGHEETFEFLLSVGHDDEEPSTDIDYDTILIILAETKGASVTSPYRSDHDGPSAGAAVRMAKLYYDRYPETLDWSNAKGRTALHVAALKGNEELVEMLCDLGADPDLTDNDGNTPLHYASAWGHVPIVQILIERGCSYTVKNNEGFTASDYAYSYSTKDTLQNTARTQYETLKNKRSRRNLLQLSAARGGSSGSSASQRSPPPPPVPPKTLHEPAGRVRSGSAASFSTGGGTSDSGDALRHHPSQSSLSTAASRGGGASRASSSTGGTLHSPASHAGALAPPPGSASALSPVATRVRAQDQDAMLKFMNRTRTRSGSADIGPAEHPAYASAEALAELHLAGAGTPRRRLRPSQSASQLGGSPPPPASPLLNTSTVRDPAGARLRAGTGPEHPPPASPRPSLSRDRTGEYTGPPHAFAQFPEPPPPGVAPIVPPPAPARRDTAEGVKTPTQSSSGGARRLPFKLSKSGGSFDNTARANGAMAGRV